MHAHWNLLALRPAPDSFHPRGPIILVVDRDDEARTLLAGSLADRGYATLSSASGHEALRIAALVTPAVIVADLYLPSGDHPCLAHAVRRHPALARVPVIAHSSFVLPADVEWARQAAVAAFVRKPASLPNLLHLIGRFAPPHPFAQDGPS